jgi:hypothetical protein
MKGVRRKNRSRQSGNSRVDMEAAKVREMQDTENEKKQT